MSNYNYLRHVRQPLFARFNEETASNEYAMIGVEDWRELMQLLLDVLRGEIDTAEIRTVLLRQIDSLNSEATPLRLESYEFNDRPVQELILILLLFRLRVRSRFGSGKRCPRVFISHRQGDELYALRIARLALNNGFAYWVDVLEPHLSIIANNPGIPQSLIPLLTASIIEMALINCTHVIACLTPATRGSLWLPYEYGRITEVYGPLRNACAWQHPQLAPADFPEYMHLGAVAANEWEIERWFNSFKKSHCHPRQDDSLLSGDLSQLPEAETA